MKSLLRLISLGAAIFFFTGLTAQTPPKAGSLIQPSQPIPTGKAPHMEVKKVKDTPEEQIYAIIFHADDDAVSGLTDFVVKHNIQDGHFTAIGAVKSATLGWLDLSQKAYHAIPVTQQSEVLSMMGDVATFKGKPAIHAHAVLGNSSGTTVGGHVWQLIVNPTLEVFLTVNTPPLQKKHDDASGMNMIDATQ